MDRRADSSADADEPWTPLDARVVTCWWLSRIASGVVSVGLAVILYSWWRSADSLGWIVGALALLLCFSLGVARLRLNQWSWRLTPWSIETRSGLLLRTHRSVPRSRVVFIDVSAGPIYQRFAVVQAELHASGSRDGSLTLPGLTTEELHDLRGELGLL